MSLFDDTCLGRNVVNSINNCEGCVCDILSGLNKHCNQLASNETIVNLQYKGTDGFVALGSGANPNATNFTFVSFNPENCCATFEYQQAGGGQGNGGMTTRRYIVDCRCLCAISPVPQNGPGTTPIIPS